MKGRVCVCAALLILLTACAKDEATKDTTGSIMEPAFDELETDNAMSIAQEQDVSAEGNAATASAMKDESWRYEIRLYYKLHDPPRFVFFLVNNSSEAYEYDSDYTIERLVDGVWTPIEENSGSRWQDDTRYKIEPGIDVCLEVDLYMKYPQIEGWSDLDWADCRGVKTVWDVEGNKEVLYTTMDPYYGLGPPSQ